VNCFDVRTEIEKRFWMEDYSEKEAERYGFAYTKRALHLGMENPLGVGTGQTGRIFATDDGLSLGAHNTYVNILSDNGWVSAALFAGSIAILWYKIWILRKKYTHLLGVDVNMVLAALTGVLSNAMWQDMVLWNFVWLIPSLCLVLLAEASRLKYRTAHE
ncbi:MAG TPA: hypothetical protein VFK47_18410, partial [Ktedonobacteraceae bacterium]|nr:hypothetical protein [Ktedonobacteraceae bacterium]